MDTGHVQELFSFDSGHVLPTITKISRVSFVSVMKYCVIICTPHGVICPMWVRDC